MVSKSKLEFHQGNTLAAVAETYPTLQKVTLETIQNAIDAGAIRISVVINFQKREILIQDDGEGASQAKFEKALRQICASQKGKDKLGRFGRGLIAPFGKCKTFMFTSCPHTKSNDYRTWTFTQDLLDQKNITGIPVEERRDIHFSKSYSTGAVQWRTEMRILDFTEDRFLSMISTDSLASDILDSYGIAMRKKKASVLIEIIDKSGKVQKRTVTAEDFQGAKLEDFSILHKDCQKTIFRMFVARKIGSKRCGKVLCGEIGDTFRVNFQKTINTFPGRGLLSEEATKALTSGIFEGEITSNIHLHPSRKSFIIDDAFIGFLITVEDWYKKIGSKYVEEVEESNKDERYQELGLRSMKVIEELCADAQFGFKEVIGSFKQGTIGIGHVEVERQVGFQEESSLSTRGLNGKQHEKIAGESSKRDAPENEKKGHSPFSVSGPRGEFRKVVKSNSLGLQFRYDELPGSDRLWELNANEGKLIFNIKHRLWLKCEPHDNAVMRLQEYIAIQALTQLSLPKEMRETAELAFETVIPPFIFTITKADALTGRKPGKKPTQVFKKAAIKN